MKLKVMSAVILLVASEAAHADWQYAKWGAPPEEVIKASKGVAKETDSETARLQSDEDDSALLYVDYQSGEYAFSGYFRFGDQKRDLQVVTLELKDINKCGPLHTSLKGKYGTGEVEDIGFTGMTTWRDGKSNNRIVYIGAMMGRPCSVSYHPLLSKESDGL